MLKPAPLQTSESGLLKKMRTYYVLALVDPETKGGDHGVYFFIQRIIRISHNMGLSDVDNEAIPPYWPPTPEALIVNNGVYELKAVSLTSVSLVTNRSVKVDAFEI